MFSSALFFSILIPSVCLFVCRPCLCQLTFLQPGPWRERRREKKNPAMSRTLTFLYRERTNSTYKMPPTPLRQIYSKICVCLERPRLSASWPPLPRKCHGVVTTSATVVRWVTLGRQRGATESPTHPGSWQMSYTSSMGAFCFLFTFLHPAALGLLSPSRQDTHTYTHTHTGERDRQRRRDINLTDMGF